LPPPMHPATRVLVNDLPETHPLTVSVQKSVAPLTRMPTIRCRPSNTPLPLLPAKASTFATKRYLQNHQKKFETKANSPDLVETQMHKTIEAPTERLRRGCVVAHLLTVERDGGNNADLRQLKELTIHRVKASTRERQPHWRTCGGFRLGACVRVFRGGGG
jgi:hypothetical protein